MTQIKRGDVVRVFFPNSDLVTSKRRPALVVQRDDLRSGLAQHLLAMITSNMSREGHPSRIKIELSSEVGRQSGLRLDSIVMTDNIVTVRSSEIDSVLGQIADMSAVDKGLQYSFGLESESSTETDEYTN